ncbi:TlpA family protein disulfide reductase [Truepera radiovictrix]|uniref:TlpA family protein disulfide reductase n=1 Tax=Truepera radiovictrix TaxID=332249 RepID=UPI0002EDFCF4|nr:TlpA disulfide reductase family protein [Truepera radiovictrix]WMT57503.1 TlpA disulfide reductase family protein [Truepera radiovictrix]
MLEHGGTYLQEPLSVLYLWQGGFSPLWGLAAAALYTLRVRERAAPLVAAAGLAAWGLSAALTAPSATETTLPPLTLTNLAGEPVALGAFAGKPLVLNLWATWCPPCRRELPLFAETAERFPEVTFALVSQGESGAQVAGFVAEQGLSLPNVLLDPGAELGRQWRAAGLPNTFFFAADGTLVYRHVGELSRARLEALVRQLGEAPEARP